MADRKRVRARRD